MGSSEAGEGTDPVDVPGPDAGQAPPRQLTLFLGILLGAAVLFALVFLAMELPQCEDPDITWVPCIGP